MNDPKAYLPVSFLDVFALDKITLYRYDGEVRLASRSTFRVLKPQRYDAAGDQDCSQVHTVMAKAQTGQNTFLVSLGMTHAVDEVWHPGLMAKLHDFKIPIWMMKFIQSYI